MIYALAAFAVFLGILGVCAAIASGRNRRAVEGERERVSGGETPQRLALRARRTGAVLVG